jgi:hypothetical protein
MTAQIHFANGLNVTGVFTGTILNGGNIGKTSEELAVGRSHVER